MAETTILRNGIYPPLPTFFDQQDELDLVTLRRHILRLAESVVAAYVVMGTHGEAVHLTSGERAQIIETVRDAGGENTPLLAGCGEQSTRATVANCQQAARSGADIALVLAPF